MFYFLMEETSYVKNLHKYNSEHLINSSLLSQSSISFTLKTFQCPKEKLISYEKLKMHLPSDLQVDFISVEPTPQINQTFRERTIRNLSWSQSAIRSNLKY